MSPPLCHRSVTNLRIETYSRRARTLPDDFGGPSRTLFRSKIRLVPAVARTACGFRACDPRGTGGIRSLFQRRLRVGRRRWFASRRWWGRGGSGPSNEGGGPGLLLTRSGRLSSDTSPCIVWMTVTKAYDKLQARVEIAIERSGQPIFRGEL